MNRPVAPASHALLLGVAVLLLCLFGIFTRPGLGLASFWPANAFMLGMLIRFPALARPASWLCCAAAYLLADVVTGAELAHNLILNGGNLLAVAVAYGLFQQMSTDDRFLRRPQSILQLLGAVLGGATVAGVIGLFANPLLFGDTAANGFLYWFATEMVNFTAFLPLLLTFPDLPAYAPGALTRWWRSWLSPKCFPLLALLGSCVAGMLIGGPGALAFPVPALLWCALTYNLFTTACLSFCFVAWALLAVRTGMLSLGAAVDSHLLISLRVGVTLVALAPLVVASTMAARTELMERLRFLAERDAMTGLRNRRSFLETGAALLRGGAGERPVATMMLDIDHFKAINDRHGHAAGDLVLSRFADVLTRSVRSQDIVGRIGGEEFAVLLPDCGAEDAAALAARTMALLDSSGVVLESGETLTPTVSIGLHVDRRERGIERLLGFADGALYRAKNAGRNRCELSVAESARDATPSADTDAATMAPTLSGRWRIRTPGGSV